MNKINWAILAPGNIAQKFSLALQGVESAHLYSVASRNPERAKAFAQKFGFETSAQSYNELLADPKVDVIYIASPHTFHAEHSIACLKAGKAVLCEKPMSINNTEAQHVFETAKQHNTFYMEAVWTRFLPIFEHLSKWINDGAIGQVGMIQASLGFSVPFNPTHRLYDNKLAGGSLLDVGIYPLTFAQWVMKDEIPTHIMALGSIGQSQVDERLGLTLKYSNGTIATLNSSITSNTCHDAWIFGSKGKIRIPHFWYSEEAHLIVGDKEESVSIPHAINGYEGEIHEVNRCLNANLLESPKMPWSNSTTIMGIMDTIRAQIGLQYPMET